MAFHAILATVFFAAALDAPTESSDAAPLRPPTVVAPKQLPKSLLGNRRIDPLLARPTDETRKPGDAEKPVKTVRSRIGTAFNRVSSPVTKWLHGESALADELKSKEFSVEANRVRKFTPEIEAINYLASLDSNSYPEIIDSLLASLDDRSPSVRLAVLESLRRKAGDRQHICSRDPRYVGVNIVDCPACKSCRKIVTRLEALLLDVDERGALKERSEFNRDLALSIMLALDSKEIPKSNFDFASDQTVETVPTVATPLAKPDLLPLPQFERPAETAAPARSKYKVFRWFESGNKSQGEAAVGTKSEKP